MKKGSLVCRTISSPTNHEHNDTWQKKTWNGLSDFSSHYVWSDGTNIYWSYGSEQYVLNGDTWEVKTWKGFTDLYGVNVWTDGTDIYYSASASYDQYVLRGDTWVVKEWTFQSFEHFPNGCGVGGNKIWSDGTNIYADVSFLQPVHYVLKGNTWQIVTWGSNLTPGGDNVWSDGTNIYYSASEDHYVLNGDTWEVKTWNGIGRFYGNDIWTDGENVYVSSQYLGQYVLNGDTWEPKTWNGVEGLEGGINIWSDGKNIYYSRFEDQYVLTRVNEPDEPETVLAWQKHDAYKPNTKWNGHTFYRVMGDKWVKQDAMNPSLIEVEPDVPEPEQPEIDPLPAVGTSLEDCTWEQISAISAAGKAAEYFSVGDTKSVDLKGTVGTLELDTTLYVYILGFDHNKDITGDTGITFGTFKTANGVSVALCDSKCEKESTDGTKYFNMNHWSNLNYGGWAGCDMRYDILGSTDIAPSGYGAKKTTSVVGYDATATCATSPVANTLMAALPKDLREVMKPMTTYADSKGNYSNLEENVTASVDYLPLMAAHEIGVGSLPNQYEANKLAKYEYHDVTNHDIKCKKYNHTNPATSVTWFTRSAQRNGDESFEIVATSGGANSGYASKSRGLAPIFLV
jgi:hypothetical protein